VGTGGAADRSWPWHAHDSAANRIPISPEQLCVRSSWQRRSTPVVIDAMRRGTTVSCSHCVVRLAKASCEATISLKAGYPPIFRHDIVVDFRAASSALNQASYKTSPFVFGLQLDVVLRVAIDRLP